MAVSVLRITSHDSINNRKQKEQWQRELFFCTRISFTLEKNPFQNPPADISRLIGQNRTLVHHTQSICQFGFGQL